MPAMTPEELAELVNSGGLDGPVSGMGPLDPVVTPKNVEQRLAQAVAAPAAGSPAGPSVPAAPPESEQGKLDREAKAHAPAPTYTLSNFLTPPGGAADAGQLVKAHWDATRDPLRVATEAMLDKSLDQRGEALGMSAAASAALKNIESKDLRGEGDNAWKFGQAQADRALASNDEYKAALLNAQAEALKAAQTKIEPDRRSTAERIGDAIAGAAGAFAATRSHTQNFAQQVIDAKLSGDVAAQKANVEQGWQRANAIRDLLAPRQSQQSLTQSHLNDAFKYMQGGQAMQREANQAQLASPLIDAQQQAALATLTGERAKLASTRDLTQYVPTHVVGGGGASRMPKIDQKNVVPIDAHGNALIFKDGAAAEDYKKEFESAQRIRDAIKVRNSALEKAKSDNNSRFAGESAHALEAAQERLQEAVRSHQAIARPGENADKITEKLIGPEISAKNPATWRDRPFAPYDEGLESDLVDRLSAKARLGSALHGRTGLVQNQQGGVELGTMALPEYDAPAPVAPTPSSFRKAGE